MWTLRSVCSLVRACRGFYEPASNVIWRYQDGLHHLLACIRGVPWEIVECRQGFTDPPPLADEAEISTWVRTL